MFGSASLKRDPFEGTAAYRRRLCLLLVGMVALALAIVACGITTAMWIRALEPLLNRISLP